MGEKSGAIVLFLSEIMQRNCHECQFFGFFFLRYLHVARLASYPCVGELFRAEKRSAQASAHPLSQAQGGLFCDCVRVFVCLSLREF